MDPYLNLNECATKIHELAIKATQNGTQVNSGNTAYIQTAFIFFPLSCITKMYPELFFYTRIDIHVG